MQVCVDRLDAVAIGSASVVASDTGPYSILEVQATLRQDLTKPADVATIAVYAQHSSAAGPSSWEDLSQLAYLPADGSPPQVRGYRPTFSGAPCRCHSPCTLTRSSLRKAYWKAS